MMTNDEYRSYLLQLWRVPTNGDTWRAQLVDVATSERHGFATLQKLVAFLETLGEEDRQPGKERNLTDSKRSTQTNKIKFNSTNKERRD